MARKRYDEGPDEYGNIEDPSTYSWNAPAPPDEPDVQVTDPPVRSPDPTIDPGNDHDPFATPPPPTNIPNGGNGGGDAALRAQIAQWAAMEGADPSLGNDPDYWVGAINSRGGLNAGNTQYWQDASVGPSAFFRNPNREQGGGGGSTSGGGGGSSQLRDLLLQMISQRQGPNANRDALYSKLNSLMDKYSQPVDENDPDIARSADAYQGDVQRSLSAFREQAAERAHAEGVGTGAFDAQIGNALQAGGRATGKYKTDLIDRERQSRRAALSGALGQTIGLLGESDNNAQSGFASTLSGLLGQEGVDNQDTQFYDNLTTNMSSHANDLDTILQELLIGR